MAYNHDLQGWRHFYPIHPCKPSWVVGKLPKTRAKNETPARPLPHYGKNPQDGVFQMGLCFLALLCKTATRADYVTFRNTTKANCLFSAYVYLHNIPKGKKIGKHLAYLAYIFNAFFFFFGAIWAHWWAHWWSRFCWWLVISWKHIQGSIATPTAIISGDLGLSMPQ